MSDRLFWQLAIGGAIIFALLCGWIWVYLTRDKRIRVKHDPCWASRDLIGSDFK